MNGSHAPLTDWAFTGLEIPEGATAMDVGCGGRRTINRLAAKEAQVYGIDFAAGSVAAKNERTAEWGVALGVALPCMLTC